jgi:beta-lactamase superfamily II metal-dependent hydrolase
VARLRENHAAILRTDVDGMITFRSDGHRIRVETNSRLLRQK